MLLLEVHRAYVSEVNTGSSENNVSDNMKASYKYSLFISLTLFKHKHEHGGTPLLAPLIIYVACMNCSYEEILSF